MENANFIINTAGPFCKGRGPKCNRDPVLPGMTICVHSCDCDEGEDVVCNHPICDFSPGEGNAITTTTTTTVSPRTYGTDT
jgi:hypothetical protein